MEEWRPIPGYPRYLASSFGRIKSLAKKKERILKQFRGPNGYWRANVIGASGRFTGPVETHRLIALAFLGEQPAHGMIVAHKNDIKSDNRPGNLLWATATVNRRQADSNGVTRLPGNGRLTPFTDEFSAVVTERKSRGMSKAAIARQFGVCLSTARRKAHSLGLSQYW